MGAMHLFFRKVLSQTIISYWKACLYIQMYNVIDSIAIPSDY
jgi:hypothetical protein